MAVSNLTARDVYVFSATCRGNRHRPYPTLIYRARDVYPVGDRYSESPVCACHPRPGWGPRDNLNLTSRFSCRKVSARILEILDSSPSSHLKAKTPMNLDDTVRSVLKQKGQNVWHVSPDGCVYDAIEIMADKHVGALMVVSEGKLVGVVSERDYARKVILQGKSSRQTQVKEIMTSPAIFMTPEQTVEDGMRIMTEKHIRHLPVVEDGNSVGRGFNR